MLSLDCGPSKIWKSEPLLVVSILEQGYCLYTALVMETRRQVCSGLSSKQLNDAHRVLESTQRNALGLEFSEEAHRTTIMKQPLTDLWCCSIALHISCS